MKDQRKRDQIDQQDMGSFLFFFVFLGYFSYDFEKSKLIFSC